MGASGTTVGRAIGAPAARTSDGLCLTTVAATEGGKGGKDSRGLQAIAALAGNRVVSLTHAAQRFELGLAIGTNVLVQRHHSPPRRVRGYFTSLLQIGQLSIMGSFPVSFCWRANLPASSDSLPLKLSERSTQTE